MVGTPEMGLCERMFTLLPGQYLSVPLLHVMLIIPVSLTERIAGTLFGPASWWSQDGFLLGTQL